MEKYIGRKIKGFKFDSNDVVLYKSDMNKYVGMTGEIIKCHTKNNVFYISFSDGVHFWYPATEALEHLVEQIFNVGDKVFDFSYGWGNIVEYSERISARYPIKVKFGDETEEYTKEGCLYDCIAKPILSFTEYTLQGFSQERPIELPEVGELCLVRDVDTQNWEVREFSHFLNGKYYTRDYRRVECYWKYMKRIKILD